MLRLAKGVVLDIDGVLLRGSSLLPQARESLARLVHADVPFVLLTNGGGEPEAVKALSLSKLLGVCIHPEQLIISSTPLRAHCKAAGLLDRRVLILGCKDVLGVARSYGLHRAVSGAQLKADDKTRYPFHAVEPLSLGKDREEPFGAVFVLHDPADMADFQLAIDVLRGGWPLGSGGNKQRVPYYISNNDLTFAGAYPVPRLAGGAFTVALSSLWKAVTGTELVVTTFGKPSLFTSTFARQQLGRWSTLMERLQYRTWAVAPGTTDLVDAVWRARMSEFEGTEVRVPDNFEQILMVGDNPRADVRLAALAGAPWRSVLVRTGVFAGGLNDPHDPGDHVVPGVAEAVDLALAR